MQKLLELSDAENNLRNEILGKYTDITEMQEKIIEIEKEIRKLQAFCEHKKYDYHPRQIAEDNSWNVCKICKIIF